MVEENVVTVPEEKGVEVTLTPESEHEEKDKVDPKIAQDKITPDMPRYREVYGKMKSYERKVEELEEKDKTTERLMEEFRIHNERLAKAIESQVELSRETITADKEKKSEDGIFNELTTHLAGLKEKKVAALKSFDYDAVTDIDEAIMETKDELKELKKTTPAKAKEIGENTEVNPAFISFLKETKWMSGDDADPLMVQAAYTMDDILLKDEKWSKKSVAERLAEVGRRVEARFNWKSVKGKNGNKSVIGSEGVSREGGRSSNVITLSPEQVAAANGLGIPLEKYARQVSLIAGGKK